MKKSLQKNLSIKPVFESSETSTLKVLQPMASAEARRNQKRTLKNAVKLSTLKPFLKPSEYAELLKLYPNEEVYAWGVRSSSTVILNRYKKMEVGSEMYGYSRYTLRLKSEVLMKIPNNPRLAKFLWKEDGKEFINIYFVTKPEEINIHISELDDKVKSYGKPIAVLRQLLVY